VVAYGSVLTKNKGITYCVKIALFALLTVSLFAATAYGSSSEGTGKIDALKTTDTATEVKRCARSARRGP